MNRSGIQRLTPIVLVALIVAISASALYSLGRTLFNGGNTNTNSSSTAVKPEDAGKEALLSTLANRSVVMTLRGPIVADENFHSYRITVTPSSRNMTTYRGYLDQTVDSVQLTNNTEAYTQFVYALNREKLMNAKPLEGDANDTRGVCPLGVLYEFSVLEGKDTVRKLWTSSCSNAKGSLKVSSLKKVNRLFKKQIPEFEKLSSKVKLSY